MSSLAGIAMEIIEHSGLENSTHDLRNHQAQQNLGLGFTNPKPNQFFSHAALGRLDNIN